LDCVFSLPHMYAMKVLTADEWLGRSDGSSATMTEGVAVSSLRPCYSETKSRLRPSRS
jgi:hypothetical protein